MARPETAATSGRAGPAGASGFMGAPMIHTGSICRIAAVLAAAVMVSPAWAAAPGTLDEGPEVSAKPVATAPIADYALDTEIVVRNWVLCVSETVAERLVQARETGVETARATYAELSAAKSCGQFSELRVILRERLYASTAESGHDARVFGALVDFAGAWASAYVVYGGLAE